MNSVIAFLQSAFIVPLALLPIINPLSNAPIFLSLSDGSETIAHRMARQVAINAWIILMVSMLIGTYVLDLFGISLPIVRLGGGLLVAATSWRLLHSEVHDAVRAAVADQAVDEPSDQEIAKRSFFPISFPLTTGPGAIAASIALGTKIPSTPAMYAMGVMVAAIGAALTAGIIFLCYRYSSAVLNKLGTIGSMVMLRLGAFILLCIGIDMMWTGWADLNHLPH